MVYRTFTLDVHVQNMGAALLSSRLTAKKEEVMAATRVDPRMQHRGGYAQERALIML